MTSEHPGSHVFQQTRTIFIHIQDTIYTNILTKFHEDSEVHIRKNAPPTGGHVFQATGTTFELVQNIIGTNLLTKFYDDRKMPRPLGGHFFPPTGTIFEPIQDIIGTNHLTKFHDDRTINVASRVLTRKNAPPPDIIRTNLLTKFHEDRKINVASRVLTSHVFQPTSIIFQLVQDIIWVNLLTKFYEDRTINGAKNAPPLGSHKKFLTKVHEHWTINVASRVFTRTNAPPLGSHVFQANLNIFELIQHIIETNLPTKFHEDWTKNVASRENCSTPGGHVFSPIWTIFKLVRDINETNVLTKFHNDWAKIVTFRVFTRNIVPPPGGHLHEIWESNVTFTVFTGFELSRGINGSNVLTKFHEDQTINVASRVFTRQNVDDGRRTTHDGQKAITKAHHEHSPTGSGFSEYQPFSAGWSECGDNTWNISRFPDDQPAENGVIRIKTNSISPSDRGIGGHFFSNLTT
ncbi:hypothetical protein DPMN_145142 [Dreissena polymorpha]|uniref:Uncharacterized protein n=1 Tax=Dreissena polymorpha TaxID=45954 RepID=A0A9D4F644_DREPO|nr:hypothetical protein DPMN_145142 [Dreissena polymorpha]